MSSLKNAAKAKGRAHRERSQPSARSHLGPLEKKQDYKVRAINHQKTKNTLKALKKRALNRNPDEFYFHMVNSNVEDGVHMEKEKEDESTPEQIKLMQTQDMKYVQFKRSIETKKIERLKGCHHLLDVETGRPPNKHTFFVDSPKEATKFDVVKHLGTHPTLIDRSYNRLRIEDLKEGKFSVPQIEPEVLKKMTTERTREYRELANRIEREKKLLVLQQKMDVKRLLMDKKSAVYNKIKPGTATSAPVYQWKQERKR
ncbi:hypothetical protein CHUAL_007788 [Chamberlinius hualienensis]